MFAAIQTGNTSYDENDMVVLNFDNHKSSGSGLIKKFLNELHGTKHLLLPLERLTWSASPASIMFSKSELAQNKAPSPASPAGPRAEREYTE